MRYLKHLPEDHSVIIDGSKACFIHPDIHGIIQDFKENAKLKNITVELIGLDDESKLEKRLPKKI